MKFVEGWNLRDAGRKSYIIPPGKSATMILNYEGEQATKIKFSWVASIPLRPKTRRKGYRLEIESLDEHLGALFGELRRLRILDDTLVIITADHGEELGEHKRFGHVDTLRNTALWVPMIVRYPPKVASGALVASTARHVDILPTILNFVGVKPPDNVRGRSLFPISDKDEHILIAETYQKQSKTTREAVRVGDLQYEHNVTKTTSGVFDVIKDPQQVHNLLDTADPKHAAFAMRAQKALDVIKSQEVAEENLDEDTLNMLRGLGYVE
ncbi:MAG: sulfatase-like hydrolase/transferase [Deltaproteobacteria bacterium]|nr:sulfatase-like hydrolase/transferase [Deltaproteobacteria bacterium]